MLIRLFSLCLCVTWLLSAPPAYCKHKNKDVPPAMQPRTEQLIRTMSAQPELMDLDYLAPELGRPENERSQSSRLDRKYYWYDSVSHTPLYELEQTLMPPPKRISAPSQLYSASGRVTESVFTVFLNQQNIKPQDITQLFGPENESSFDAQGIPCKLYHTIPNTTLVFVEPPGAFRVAQARISYKGPPLPPVSQFERDQADAADVRLASHELDVHDWHAAEQHLRRHLSRYPQDAAVHLELAQTLREEGEINDAINEYRAALAFAGGNEELRGKCLSGLQELKVTQP